MSNEKPGATGDFPEGKINEADEGGLNIRIGHDPERGVVVIEFGKEIAWVAFNAEQADGLAAMIKEHAEQLRKSMN